MAKRRTLLYVPFLLCIAEHDKEQPKLGATARRVTCVRHLPPLLLYALFHTLATHCGDSTAARLCVMLVVILLRRKQAAAPVAAATHTLDCDCSALS